MKVFTTEQIRKADDFTIGHEPLPSLDLMERAATGLAGYINAQPWSDRVIRIFSGYGNNGGDGIALARLLAENGRTVILHVITPEKTWSPDAKANLDRLPVMDNLSVTYLDEDDLLPEIGRNDLVVDALFGSGLTREPEGFLAELIDHINLSKAKVLAIDVPSGLYGEDNRLNSKRHVIRASLTLSFQFPKLCFFFSENHPFVGDWTVIPIGLHPDFISAEPTPWNFTGIGDAAGWIKERPRFSHKGTYGHALLISGSIGKMGAAVLAASACIRSGSGLTTVVLPYAGNPILQAAVPEAMTILDNDPDRWTFIPELSPYSAIGAGPGIGTDPVTGQALDRLLTDSRIPLILDADALNLLALNAGSLLQVPKNSILTPHPGEFKRVFGDDPDDYTRIMRLKELANFYGLVIVLKGAHTAVAGPDGTVWFNTTGNPGMATGGSGDVLTGLITGLVAQGYDTFMAARLGVFIHGLAGDIAAMNTGMEALKAGDIMDSIGLAFLRIHSSRA